VTGSCTGSIATGPPPAGSWTACGTDRGSLAAAT
jgi:hypothetical protein